MLYLDVIGCHTTSTANNGLVQGKPCATVPHSSQHTTVAVVHLNSLPRPNRARDVVSTATRQQAPQISHAQACVALKTLITSASTFAVVNTPKIVDACKRVCSAQIAQSAAPANGPPTPGARRLRRWRGHQSQSYPLWRWMLRMHSMRHKRALAVDRAVLCLHMSFAALCMDRRGSRLPAVDDGVLEENTGTLIRLEGKVVITCRPTAPSDTALLYVRSPAHYKHVHATRFSSCACWHMSAFQRQQGASF